MLILEMLRDLKVSSSNPSQVFFLHLKIIPRIVDDVRVCNLKTSIRLESALNFGNLEEISSSDDDQKSLRLAGALIFMNL